MREAHLVSLCQDTQVREAHLVSFCQDTQVREAHLVSQDTQVREAHLVSASDLMSESLRTRTPIDSPMSGARGTQVREAHPDT